MAAGVVALRFCFVFCLHIWTSLADVGDADCDSSGDGCDAQESVERRLFALPQVISASHQDTDIVKTYIGGRLYWVPPAASTPFWNEVNGYKIYLVDEWGTPASLLATVVGVGNHYYDIPVGTAMNNFSSFSVRTTSPLGESPTGHRHEICDVDHTDTLHIVNAIATPGVPWGVIKLEFYEDPLCGGLQMLWANTASTGDAVGHPNGKAFDGNLLTSWVPNCTTCALGSSSIGLVGVCRAEEVRCIKIRQCLAGETSGGACPLAVGRSTALDLMVRGELTQTWKALTPHTLTNVYYEETLVIAGRRRRAAFGVLSAATYDVVLERTTNPGFTR